MSSAAFAERERILPPSRRFSLQLGDFVVIAIVFGGVFATSANLLGVRDMATRIALVIGWVCAAAKRIVAWRHRGHQQVVIAADAKAIALVIGVVPWFVMPLLHARFPDWAVWSPMAFPVVCRAAGGGLMAYSAFKPFLSASGSGSGLPEEQMAFADYSSGGYMTFDTVLHAAGLFLLTASPVIGALVVCWIALTCSVDRMLVTAARIHAFLRLAPTPTLNS
jgi:hypothetical protein